MKTINRGREPILSARIPQGSAVTPKRRYIQKDKAKVCAISIPNPAESGRSTAGNTSMLKWLKK